MKYIFIDVDGTLYSAKTQSVPYTAKKAIQIARENGHKVYLCTGRNEVSCKNLGIDVDGYILSVGACVKTNGKVIFNNPLSSKEIETVLTTLKELGMGYSIECKDGSYCNSIGFEAITRFFTQGRFDDQAKEVSYKNYFFEKDIKEYNNVYKFGIYSKDLQTIETFKKSLNTYWTFNVSSYLDGWYLAELSRSTITKATGIQVIMEYFDVDLKDTIGIGDSSNDISMLSLCNTSVCMLNGDELLKEYADFITDDVDRDGLYKAFKQLGII